MEVRVWVLFAFVKTDNGDSEGVKEGEGAHAVEDGPTHGDVEGAKNDMAGEKKVG